MEMIYSIAKPTQSHHGLQQLSPNCCFPPENLNFWLDVRTSWRKAFTLVSPTAAVDLYDPLVERKFPDASKYNLVVLSGGMADVSYSLPWVLDVLEYVRMVARDFPATKILGICWGHNAVSRALGGQATIEDIHLTEAGKQFFPFAATSGSTKLATPAPSFILLAENHECFVNETNNVPTFQAHPKLSNDMAKKMLLGGTTETSTEQLEKEFEKLDKPTDGVKLLERIIQWLKE